MREPTTRRRFLTRVAASAAGAFALPAIVPAKALGKDKQAAASQRISIGIIGCGKIATSFHRRALSDMSDVQVTAVCDVDRTRREHARDYFNQAYSDRTTFKGCAAADDFREVIADEGIDAVLIATPDHWHAIPIIEACQAGKDVYCEKPLTLSILEAKRCIEAVEKHKTVFQTGSQQRSNQKGYHFRKAISILRSGRLGEIKKVTVGVGEPSYWCDLPAEQMEPGLNWDMWLGQAPMRPYNSVLSPRGLHDHFPKWRLYREYSGGAHTDLGAHHYDIAQWALGMDDSGPVEIIPPESPESGHGVRYRYENGVEMVHVKQPSGCVFYGTEGQLHIKRGVLTSEPANIVEDPLRDDEFQLPETPGHHRNWVDCIKTRQTCVAPVNAGARTVTVVHLGNLAYWHKRRFQWDPKNWQFVDDNEANERFLDVERRAPRRLPKV